MYDDDDPFDPIISEVGETLTLDTLRRYEQLYFPDVKSVADVQVVAVLGGNASCFLPDKNTIQIHRNIAPFAKLCGFLLLHELIHSALYKRDRDPDAEHGPRFKAEIKRLKDAGAYDNLY